MPRRRERPRFARAAGAGGGTWIRACCRDCGEVRFRSSSASLVVDAGSWSVRLCFPCPKCGVRSARPLPAPVVDRLRGVGVAVRLLTRPAEAGEVHDGPPLDELDAARFVRLLEQPGWQAQLRTRP